MPFSSHQRTSASSRPCVTQTSDAPVSSIVSISSSQSEWSEMMSGSSTPRCLGALADAHPARGEARHRVGEAPRPAVGEGRGRADDDGAGELILRAALDRRGRERPEPTPCALVIVR
jgi:hypothetical protein